MTSYKRISLYVALLAVFSLVNCVDSKKSAELDKKYPQKPTEFVEYKVDIDEKQAPAGSQPQAPKVIFDDNFTNYFILGLERKRVTTEIKDGNSITTTETWTRIKEEPLTWTQIGMGAAGATALLVGGAYLGSKYGASAGGQHAHKLTQEKINRGELIKGGDDLKWALENGYSVPSKIFNVYKLTLSQNDWSNLIKYGLNQLT